MGLMPDTEKELYKNYKYYSISAIGIDFLHPLETVTKCFHYFKTCLTVMLISGVNHNRQGPAVSIGNDMSLATFYFFVISNFFYNLPPIFGQVSWIIRFVHLLCVYPVNNHKDTKYNPTNKLNFKYIC